MNWPDNRNLSRKQMRRWALRAEADGFRFFMLEPVLTGMLIGAPVLTQLRWAPVSAAHAAAWWYELRKGMARRDDMSFLIVDGRQVRFNAAIDVAVANNVEGAHG